MLTSIPEWALIEDGGGVDAAHRGDRLADKVGIAWRVDDVEASGVVEVNQARFDSVLVVLLFFVEVADAGARVDAGRMVNGSGFGEQRVGQHGLAGRAVPAENDVADVLDFVLSHESILWA